MKPLLLFFSVLLTTVISAQNRYDVVIDEIMADPSPQVKLPGTEWIELKNTSSFAINLKGWRIGDAAGQSGPMPQFILAPDSFVIVCTGSAAPGLTPFGATLPVTSFPSLDNDGETIFLKAANGMIVHAVNYSTEWYRNELKQEGGWSLEMIDTHNPCSGKSNWKASAHTDGGTPGTKNAVDGLTNDQSAPQLQQAIAANSTTILLSFDEPLDSLGGATVSNYSMDGGISFSSGKTLAPLFNQVELATNIALSGNTVYTLQAMNIKDCRGNNMDAAVSIRTGLMTDAAAGDGIINEILFNPRPNAYDYVELYNKSDKILDASRLFIANRNSAGVISSINAMSATAFNIFPGDHVVITENADNLALNYHVKNPDAVLVLSSLPSFPDDEGTVIILNQQGDVIDELHYRDDWHFTLIDDAEGISLERIEMNEPSQNAGNWHSAASTAGYGTPGYKNSQSRNQQTIAAAIEVSPKIFSPDNDGFDDIAAIQYQMTEPGYVANITIFDAAGRPVRNLVRNGTLGRSGSWNWDGLDDKGLKLPVGTYVLFTELFNLQGKKQGFKHSIVLARKLN